jgi:hypothetical protein
MNSSEIFTLALGLTEPWYITKVEIQTDDDSVKALHIHLGFKRGSKFKDELGEKCSIHDTLDKTWRHLNFFEQNLPIGFFIDPFFVFLAISFALFSRVIQSWR